MKELVSILIFFFFVLLVFSSIPSSVSSVADKLINHYVLILTERAMGSGFNLGNGYVITVKHNVVSENQENPDSMILGVDKEKSSLYDLFWFNENFAVYKDKIEKDKSLLWNNFAEPKLGEFVFFIAPYNKDGIIINTVKLGLVSFVGRDFFWIQAEVLPGTSGTAILDKDGNLLGLIESLFIASSLVEDKLTKATKEIDNFFIEVKKLDKDILANLK